MEQSEQLWAGQHLASVNPDDTRELLNYRQAFDLVASYVGDGELITEGLIREIHKRLVEGVRGNAATLGDYRKIQNYVVNSKTKDVIYTPPAAYEVSQMMHELVDWINHESEIHPVLMSGIAQFQFVHIHPFLDGNGRAARLLTTLCLYQRGFDAHFLLTKCQLNLEKLRLAFVTYLAMTDVDLSNLKSNYINYNIRDYAINYCRCCVKKICLEEKMRC